ncbi:MAG: aminopeptidase N [bacterium]|nr:aminopeptidase N [bacterium]
MSDKKPETIYLKDYQVPAFLIDNVDLDIKLHPTKTKVDARLTMRRNPDHPDQSAPLVLNGENIELLEIAIDARSLEKEAYTTDNNLLTIEPDAAQNLPPPSASFTLITSSICNPQDNKALSGLYRSSDIYCTQCEAEGFRRITWFIDRPDILSRYRVRLEADKKQTPVLLANGNLVEQGESEDKQKHFASWEDPFPKPSYLFAMVGGQLGVVKDSFTTMSGRKVDLHIYVEPGKEDRCEWAMDCLKRSMKWDETRFGREYDLDLFMIVAVSDFNMGAMENKGLNIFNDKLILARPDTATDGDYAAIESVIAHEYFHNWTGNRITCRDWFQLCLKEGLTVFRDQEFSSDERDRTAQRIADVRSLRSFQFPEDAGPLAHPVRPDHFIEINNFYTSTVYSKGAEVIRMIHTMLGEQGFRKGMDLYFDRHDGDAATVEQFIKCFEEACDIDLEQFMLWYSQAGTPELVCSLEHDEKSKTATLNVTQMLSPSPGQKTKKAQHIPLKIGLIGDNGADLPLMLEDGQKLDDGLLHIREFEQKTVFTNIAMRPTLSLLRNFSAPVTLKTNFDNDDLLFLLRHDADRFNRWQVAQTYMLRLLLTNVKATQKDQPLDHGEQLGEALSLALSEKQLDPLFSPGLLAFPGINDVARELGGDVNHQLILEIRNKLRSNIGEQLRELLTQIYDNTDVSGPFNPDAKSAAKRGLRHATLGLLGATGKPDDIARLYQHYQGANNMSEKATALGYLAQTNAPERQLAFDDFFDKWQKDHLVIDKWFAMQAMSPQDDALERIETLMENKLFSLKNPNKVRAVIGAFAMGNPVQFNRADGRGYEFMARNILEIDCFNPQIASRLAGSFKSWRILEPQRRDKLKTVLDELASHNNLSPDTYEIISKVIQ